MEMSLALAVDNPQCRGGSDLRIALIQNGNNGVCNNSYINFTRDTRVLLFSVYYCYYNYIIVNWNLSSIR